MIMYCSEKDLMGVIEVLVDKFWGVQIQCLLEYFCILIEKMFGELIYVLVLIKWVVVKVNQDFGLLMVEKVGVIVVVVDEVLVGKYVQEFFLVIWQIGFGI